MDWHVKHRAASIAAATLLAASALPAAAAAAQKRWHPAAPAASAAMPPQGLYDECAPISDPQACEGRLDQMAQAGFTVVLNYDVWDGSAAQITAYADRAQALGMKVIWPMNADAWRNQDKLLTQYSTLARDCGCSDGAGFVKFVVNLVQASPATWGYYLADEPTPDQAAPVSTLARQIAALDPAHQRLIMSQGFDTPDVAANVAPFLGLADVAGTDVYPIGDGQLVSDVGTASAQLRAMAGTQHKQIAVALQSFSYGQYADSMPTFAARWPTETEMRQMRDQAIAQGPPSLLLWYSFYDVSRSGNPAGHWHDLVQAAFGPPSSPSATVASVARARTTRRGRGQQARRARQLHHKRRSPMHHRRRRHQKRPRGGHKRHMTRRRTVTAAQPSVAMLPATTSTI